MADPDTISAAAKLVATDPQSQGRGPLLGGFPLLDLRVTEDDTLQKVLEENLLPALKAHLGTFGPNEKFAFAAVDLTDDDQAPYYAGFNDTNVLWIASLGKILSLYGMFQLRADLRWAAQAAKTTDLDVLGPVLRQEYWRLHRAATLTRAATSTLPAAFSRPMVEKMFELRGGKLDFNADNRADAGLTDGKDARAYRVSHNTHTSTIVTNDLNLRNELDNPSHLPVQELMRFIGYQSDDSSAAVITQALGFRHLWALTNNAGLFRTKWREIPATSKTPTEAGGLYLALDYWRGVWDNAEKRSVIPTFPLGTWQGGTARSIAMFFTLLAQDRLMNSEQDSDSHVLLREMLRRDRDMSRPTDRFFVRGEWSPIGQGMSGKTSAGDLRGMTKPFIVEQEHFNWGTAVPPVPSNLDPSTAELAVSKIGFGTDDYGTHSMANALHVQTMRNTSPGGTKRIKLVMVGMCQGPRAKMAGERESYEKCLEIFGEQMLNYLKTRYNLS